MMWYYSGRTNPDDCLHQKDKSSHSDWFGATTGFVHQEINTSIFPNLQREHEANEESKVDSKILNDPTDPLRINRDLFNH